MVMGSCGLFQGILVTFLIRSLIMLADCLVHLTAGVTNHKWLKLSWTSPTYLPEAVTKVLTSSWSLS